MMRFRNIISAAIMTAICLSGAAGCTAKGESYMIKEGGKVILDNGKISLELDGTTGGIVGLKNKMTGINNLAQECLSPVSLDYSINREEIIIGKPENTVHKITSGTTKDTTTVKVAYKNLKINATKQQTDINLVISYSLAKDSEYVKISSAIDLKDSKEDIYAVRYFPSSQFFVNGKDFTMTAPIWGGGNKWLSPTENSNFKEQKTMPYPGEDDKTLECGWVDLNTQAGGIGIGIINRSQMATEFTFKAVEDSMQLSWVLFDPQQILGKSVPLEKGQKFTTDEMLLAPHSGDWHSMADIYRKEYQAAFTLKNGSADYLTWENISAKVKKTDYMIRFFAGLDNEFVTSFEQMYTSTVTQIQAMEADSKNCMVWIAGQNEKGYAFDVPIMTPTYPLAGGDKGIKELSDKLHAIGATVFHYEHPFAVDPNGKGYFKETDPFQHTEAWNLCTHHSVCIDNRIMQNLWNDKIIPEISNLGADGVQFDQAPLQQTVCDLDGHDHKLTAVERLSSHAKAITKLEQSVRSKISRDGFIVSEGASDLLCRYIDVRQNGWHVKPRWDGEYEWSATQYTFPQYIVQASSIYQTQEGYAENAMLRGAISGNITCLSDGGDAAIKKEYIRFRNEIRQKKAPAFPYGFRDCIGLTTNHERLIAKVFVDGNDLTVTYLSDRKPIQDAVIQIDLDVLGFNRKGIKEIKLGDLKRNQCGFEVLSIS